MLRIGLDVAPLRLAPRMLAALIGLRELGYTYAIIGDAGPVDFYRNAIGAMLIPIDEGRGIYHLKQEPGLLT